MFWGKAGRDEGGDGSEPGRGLLGLEALSQKKPFCRSQNNQHSGNRPKRMTSSEMSPCQKLRT